MRILSRGFRSTLQILIYTSFVVGALMAWFQPAWAAPEDPAQAAEAVTRDLTAQEILDKAGTVQGGGEIARNLRSFSADFETEYYKEDEGQVYYQVKRLFQYPCVLWTEKKHETQAKPTWEVYNGEDGWFIDAEKKVTVYTDKPSTYETDIENLEEDVRVTRELFRYFFIAKLSRELNDMERLSDEPVFKGNPPVHVVAGKTTTYAGGEEEKTVYLKIYIDPKESLVVAVRMKNLDAQLQDRLFIFEKHLKNRQGVLVPTLIKMYGEEEKKPEMKIFINSEKGDDDKFYPMIDFNIKIDPKLVNLPEKEE
ncbi:MAG: hypothetical protein ABIK28_22490 [Planctomycetota bacterium]